jgi:hypothetical protein
MKFVFAAIVALVALVAVVGFAAADHLPNQTPENQIFSIDTVLDVTGIVDESNNLDWLITNGGSIPTGTIGYKAVIADVAFKDNILTNGGKLAENKNFAFDSTDKGKGLYNLENEKVLTYASTEGAHMVGEEQYTLDVAGNWDTGANNLRCVFAAPAGGLPAFCNVVTASANLINVNSAQISTKGQIRAVATGADAPAELNYRIAVTPDANSGSGFAEGTVSTTFAGSIMEARDYGDANFLSANPTWNKTAATNQWKDSTTVTGGIKAFQKALNYKSGYSF